MTDDSMGDFIALIEKPLLTSNIATNIYKKYIKRDFSLITLMTVCEVPPHFTSASRQPPIKIPWCYHCW